MSETRFSTATKTFHWLTALLILTIVPLGVIAGRLPTDTDAQILQVTRLFSLHKTLGVIVFLVAFLRVVYALSQTKPAPLHPDRKAETLLAEVVHWLLYISLILVPLTGWIHHSAAAIGAPIWVPFASQLPFVPKDPSISDLFGGLHWLWSKVMVASILLHVAGALKHHFIDKDATLRRMWFGSTETPPRPHNTSRLPAILAIGIYAVVAGIGSATGILGHSTDRNATELTQAVSEWQVQSGEIGLTITQLGNPVTGSFQNWTSSITFDEAASGIAGTVTTTIDISSLQLGSVADQAMGSDYFDQTTHPTAVFTGELLNEGDAYLANGTLTIRGQSVPLAFPFTLEVADDTGVMSAEFEIDRQVFGIGQSITDESNLANGVVVTLVLTAMR